MTFSRLFSFGFIGGLVLIALFTFFAAGCDDAAVAPTPTPVPPPVAVAPTPPVAEALPVGEAYCPYVAFDNLRLTEIRQGTFQVSFNVNLDSFKAYLKRYQLQVFRNGSEFATKEIEVTRLGGPKGITYTTEWVFPGVDPGAISVRLRVHYPDECRDDGNGNVRANGPWSDLVTSEN